MNILDLRDPVAVGTPLTYEIRVTNEGATASASDVVLVVTVPDEMTPVPAGSTGPTKCSISGQTVRFEPVAEFRPGERPPLSYRVYVNTLRPGKVALKAQLTHRGQSTPVLLQEETEILPQ